MLALRTTNGLSIKEFNQNFDADFFNDYKEVLTKKAEFLDIAEDRVRIKDKYLYVQNDIILNFMR